MSLKAKFRRVPDNAIPHGGSRAYFDLTVGDQVIIKWDELKNGNDSRAARKIADSIEMMRKIFGFSSLDIQANHARNDFWVTIDGKRNLLSAIGSGFSQFLVFFVGVIMREYTFILINELELHLHPSLQSEFVSTLRSFASNGVVFSTHSIGLARAVADRIYSLRRKGGYNEVRTRCDPTDRGRAARSSDRPTRSSGRFATRSSCRPGDGRDA